MRSQYTAGSGAAGQKGILPFFFCGCRRFDLAGCLTHLFARSFLFIVPQPTIPDKQNAALYSGSIEIPMAVKNRTPPPAMCRGSIPQTFVQRMDLPPLSVSKPDLNFDFPTNSQNSKKPRNRIAPGLFRSSSRTKHPSQDQHRIANVSETYRISTFCDFFYAEKVRSSRPIHFTTKK